MCADFCSRHAGNCAPLCTLARRLGALPQPYPHPHRERKSVDMTAGGALPQDWGTRRAIDEPRPPSLYLILDAAHYRSVPSLFPMELFRR